MNTRNLELASAGGVVAYDAKTGEIVWMHQRVVEVEMGYGADDADLVTEDDCEAIRERAAEAFPNREIRVLSVSADAASDAEGPRKVDLETGRLVEEDRGAPSLAERFADAG